MICPNCKSPDRVISETKIRNEKGLVTFYCLTCSVAFDSTGQLKPPATVSQFTRTQATQFKDRLQQVGDDLKAKQQALKAKMEQMLGKFPNSPAFKDMKPFITPDDREED
jgi:hypothetical protein